MRLLSIGLAGQAVHIGGHHLPQRGEVGSEAGRTRVQGHGGVPAFEVGLHPVAQVGQHRARVGGEGARALLDVVAGQGDAGLQQFGVNPAAQLTELALEQRARGGCGVLGEDGVGADGGVGLWRWSGGGFAHLGASLGQHPDGFGFQIRGVVGSLRIDAAGRDAAPLPILEADVLLLGCDVVTAIGEVLAEIDEAVVCLADGGRLDLHGLERALHVGNQLTGREGVAAAAHTATSIYRRGRRR